MSRKKWASLPEYRGPAGRVALWIFGSTLVLPALVLVLADLCHLGNGNCLIKAAQEIGHGFGSLLSLNIMLGWAGFLLAPVAFRLLGSHPTGARRMAVLIAWTLVTLSNGLLGLIWGPLEPAAKEAYLLAPFVSGPLGILAISLITGWADSRPAKVLATLMSAGAAAMATVWIAGSFDFHMRSIPEELDLQDLLNGIMSLLVVAVLWIVPVSVWTTGVGGWTLLALLERDRPARP